MEDISEIIDSLNPVQKQVSILTHELCNLLDATRPLARPARLNLLKKATTALKGFTDKANSIHMLSPIDKRKLTMRLLKRKYNVQV